MVPDHHNHAIKQHRAASWDFTDRKGIYVTQYTLKSGQIKEIKLHEQIHYSQEFIPNYR